MKVVRAAIPGHFLAAGFTGVLAAAIGVFGATPCSADAETQQLVSRALLALDAQDYVAAERDLSAAIESEPQSAEALYYRGLVRIRSERFADAVSDLQAALAQDPQMIAARTSLGYALYRSDRFDDAAAALDPVDPRAPLAGESLFTLGLAELGRGREAAAAARFTEAAADDASLAMPAAYYRGVCAARGGDEKEARDRFEEVRGAASSQELAAAATRQIQTLDAGSQRPYRLYGSLGLEYDSNVALVAEDGSTQDDQLSDIGVSDEADGRTTIVAGAIYTPVRSERLQLAIGYELFQSLHFDLDDFDMQDHRATAALAATCGVYSCGLDGSYDYYLRDGESFLGEAAVAPWVQRTDPRWGDTKLYYRFRDRSFHGTHFDRALDDLRDGDNHAVGVRQTIGLGAEGPDLTLGYRYDHDEADHSDGRAYDYDGHTVETGLAWALPARLLATASYAYKYENYDSGSDGREDNEHHASMSLRRELVRHLAVVGGYRYTFNDSNQDAFQYDRHITSIALEMSY